MTGWSPGSLRPDPRPRLPRPDREALRPSRPPPATAYRVSFLSLRCRCPRARTVRSRRSRGSQFEVTCQRGVRYRRDPERVEPRRALVDDLHEILVHDVTGPRAVVGAARAQRGLQLAAVAVLHRGIEAHDLRDDLPLSLGAVSAFCEHGGPTPAPVGRRLDPKLPSPSIRDQAEWAQGRVGVLHPEFDPFR